jgi:hypothetical protein
MLYRGVVLKSGPFLRGGKSPQPALELPRSWLSAPGQVSFSFVAVYQSHIVLLSQRPRRGRGNSSQKKLASGSTDSGETCWGVDNSARNARTNLRP